MSRLPRLETIPEAAEELMEVSGPLMGFTPNDALDMARSPAILSGVTEMVKGVYGAGTLDAGLKRLIGYVSSTAAGCVYCQSHTVHGAERAGVEAEKVAHAWEYETSELFTEPERAALRLAHLGSLSPSQVSDKDFAAAREHFSDVEIMEVVGVISMFGFLNRWNAIMGTDIEEVPRAAVARAGVELR